MDEVQPLLLIFRERKQEKEVEEEKKKLKMDDFYNLLTVTLFPRSDP